MPPVIVIFVCKTILLAAPDPFTRWENREWDLTGSVMHCRRIETQVTDASADQGATPQPFNQQSCQRSAMMLGPAWDTANSGSKYRFWKAACPTRIINTVTGETIGWKLPECPTDGTTICEQDSAI